MKQKWTKELTEKLIELYPVICNRELSIIFKRSKISISSKARHLNIKKINKTRNWTKKEVEDLIKLYPDNDNLFLSSYFDRPIKKIYQKIRTLNLKKSKEYIDKIKVIWGEHVKEVGKEFRFIKGQKAWNEGIKGYMGSNVTSFKKGNRPHNYKPIGSERKDRDNYTLVKIDDPNVWKLKHRMIWENIFGKVPEKHSVIFVDGDKTNFDLNNLALVHRKELLYFNRHGKYPKEIFEVEKLIIQLKNFIKNGKEQN